MICDEFVPYKYPKKKRYSTRNRTGHVAIVHEEINGKPRCKTFGCFPVMSANLSKVTCKTCNRKRTGRWWK